MLPQGSDHLYISRSGSLFKVTWEKIKRRDSSLNSSDRLIFERNRVKMYITLGNFWNNGQSLLTVTDYFLVERNYVLYKSPIIIDFTPDNWVKVLRRSDGATRSFKFRVTSQGGTVRTSQGRQVNLTSSNSGYNKQLQVDLYEDVWINFPKNSIKVINFRDSADEFEIDPYFDLSRMEDVSNMFSVSNFNGQGVQTWNMAKFTNFHKMFYQAPLVNANLSQWDTSNVTNFSEMFYYAKNFNGAVFSWNTAKVTNMAYMFDEARKFNQPLTNWTTSNCTDMYAMFDNDESFNQPLAHFNVANVRNLGYMFSGQRGNTFNQDISGWDVSNVTFFEGMFKTTNTFTRDLTSWCVPQQRVRPANWDDFGVYKNFRSIHPNWGSCGAPSLPPYNPPADVCHNTGIIQHITQLPAFVDLHGKGDTTVVLNPGSIKMLLGYSVVFGDGGVPSEFLSDIVNGKDTAFRIGSFPNGKWVLATYGGKTWTSSTGYDGWTDSSVNMFAGLGGSGWENVEAVADCNVFASIAKNGSNQNALVYSTNGTTWKQATVPWNRNTATNLAIKGGEGYYAVQVGSELYFNPAAGDLDNWLEAKWAGQPSKLDTFGHLGFMWGDNTKISTYNPWTDESTEEPTPWSAAGNSSANIPESEFVRCLYSQRTYYAVGNYGVVVSYCPGDKWYLHRSPPDAGDRRYDVLRFYKSNLNRHHCWQKDRAGAIVGYII